MLRMVTSIVGLSGLSALASAQTPESSYGQLQERLAAAEAAALNTFLPGIPTTDSGEWLPIGVVTDRTDG